MTFNSSLDESTVQVFVEEHFADCGVEGCLISADWCTQFPVVIVTVRRYLLAMRKLETISAKIQAQIDPDLSLSIEPAPNADVNEVEVLSVVKNFLHDAGVEGMVITGGQHEHYEVIVTVRHPKQALGEGGARIRELQERLQKLTGWYNHLNVFVERYSSAPRSVARNGDVNWIAVAKEMKEQKITATIKQQTSQFSENSGQEDWGVLEQTPTAWSLGWENDSTLAPEIITTLAPQEPASKRQQEQVFDAPRNRAQQQQQVLDVPTKPVHCKREKTQSLNWREAIRSEKYATPEFLRWLDNLYEK